MRQGKRWVVAALTAAFLWVGLGEMSPSIAAAQTCDPASITCSTIGPDGKGALAGGILGAEIGFIIPAIIVNAGVRELDEWWSWVLFPALGAVGGALGGYYGLEDPSQTDASGAVTQRGFPEVAVAMLAVSMALIVPTFVGVLALTAYNPGASDSGGGATSDEDDAADPSTPDDGDEVTAEPAPEPAPSEDAQQSAIRRTLAGGPGLFRYDRGQLLLGMPMVYSADTYTAEERAHLQLPQSADLRIPLVSGVF